MGKYFGTDGFRGVSNIDLCPNHAFLIGSYFGQQAVKESGDKAKIVIGKDSRLSGDMFINSLCAGSTSAGCDTFVLDIVPTPAVAYITKSFSYNYGVMVSASHNPYNDNGIKVLNANGEKVNDDIIDECEKYIDNGTDNVVLAQGDKIGISKGCKRDVDAYVHHLKNAAKHSFNGLKIALDCANGSASSFAQEIFSDLGAKVDVIHNSPDGVNINVECGSTHIQDLCRMVKNGDYDMGFAFDGDADRCLAVDGQGNEVSGDELMLLCARMLLKYNKLNNNTLVTTVMSNFGLYKALDNYGIDYVRTDVGDRFVYENMSENNHSIGGEQSGHIIFREHATTGDGMLTAIMVVDSLIDLSETLAEAAGKMTVFPQVLKNVTVTDKSCTMNNGKVKASIDKVTDLLGDDGRILVRPSGTEPYVRVMVEASTTETCDKMVKIVVDTMQEEGLLK